MTIYLYKKTHAVTGKKYLGKTSKKDPYKYLGSGQDWLVHLEEFGKNVETEIIRECQSKQELNYWGRYYSELWNIVESDEWANKIPETGGGQGISGELQKIIQTRSDVQTKRIAKMKETNATSLTQHRRSVAMKKIYSTEEVKSKVSGKNNHKYDHTIYTFHGPNGVIKNCTRQELIKEFDLEPRAVTRLVHGKIKSSLGWKLMSQPKNSWKKRA
jgi:hypothetical protein